MPGPGFYSLGHLQHQNISGAALVASSDVQEKMRIPRGAVPSDRGFSWCLSSSLLGEQGRSPRVWEMEKLLPVGNVVNVSPCSEEPGQQTTSECAQHSHSRWRSPWLRLQACQCTQAGFGSHLLEKRSLEVYLSGRKVVPIKHRTSEKSSHPCSIREASLPLLQLERSFIPTVPASFHSLALWVGLEQKLQISVVGVWQMCFLTGNAQGQEH